MRMLAATRLAPAIEHNLDTYASYRAYLRLAADLALQQLRRGLPHAYRRLDLRLPVVRGRLRIAAQLARLPERLDAHLLMADELGAIRIELLAHHRGPIPGERAASEEA